MEDTTPGSYTRTHARTRTHTHTEQPTPVVPSTHYYQPHALLVVVMQPIAPLMVPLPLFLGNVYNLLYLAILYHVSCSINTSKLFTSARQHKWSVSPWPRPSI